MLARAFWRALAFLHVGSWLSAQHRLDAVEIEASHWLVVDFEDAVARAHARVECKPFERAEHENVVAVAADGEADAA
eukprot:3457215-Pleurochrysis_carterae.AAC.1